MQINFDSYGDEFKIAFERHVQQVWPEIRKLLPVIPKLDEMTFWFNNALIVPGTNTGGFALSKNEIALGADLVEYSILADEMKAGLFHEAYHVAHGFTGEETNPDLSALQNAVYEGAACVFEISHADSDPVYARYDQEFISTWLPQVAELDESWKQDFRKWKFWDPETGTKHILYRIGTYVADQAVEKSGTPIEQLAQCSADEIIELAQIDT